jgi:hypothetical protein
VLRLLVRGHDIKSIARELSISTTAANERLRAARQKLGVSTSREAARVLAAAEGHDFHADTEIGVSADPAGRQQRRPVFIWIGVIMAVAAATTIALMALLGSHASHQGAPTVVRTDPPANAIIAPGPFTLSVTFDQPMAEGSFSFVQKSSESFPSCAFPAVLSSDKRTFTVRCTTEAGRSYEIWFNSPPYMNFKGVNGMPAQPHQLLFRTKSR